MNWFKDNIVEMEAYVPGEQPKGDAPVVKLNTNENPYPPSPAVADVLHHFDTACLRRYPDAMAGEFRRAASEALGVPTDWILPGDGSDDLIMMIARACLGKGRAVAYPVPTFDFYFTQAQIQDAPRIELPLEPDSFRLPLDAMRSAGAAVTFVANPNSPTGVAATTDELDSLASDLDGLLVVDEAYADFASENAMSLVEKHENVIVLRTLSKGYSLAGLRLGFAIAQPTVLAGLLKTKSIYNVGWLPCAAGAAAMRDQDYKNVNARNVVATRRRLVDELEQMGWSVLPSETNFILASPPGGAGGIAAELKERNILVRYYDRPRLRDSMRITVGTDEETDLLLNELRNLQA
ncbi:MAG: histidinol-phosphate transaminase [Phycisphaerae bacterium]